MLLSDKDRRATHSGMNSFGHKPRFWSFPRCYQDRCSFKCNIFISDACELFKLLWCIALDLINLNSIFSLSCFASELETCTVHDNLFEKFKTINPLTRQIWQIMEMQ